MLTSPMSPELVARAQAELIAADAESRNFVLAAAVAVVRSELRNLRICRDGRDPGN
jgi:hypothetical protein